MGTDRFDERGILTDSDVNFLKGKRSPDSASQQSRARQRIRERVAAAIHDFEILLEYWPDEQQRKTLDLIDEKGTKSPEELGADMVALLYTLLNSGNRRSDLVLEDDPVEQLMRFRSSLSRGIRKGKRTLEDSPGVVSLATTTPLYETPDPETVRSDMSSTVLTDAHRKINEKYRRSMLYEDDEIIIEERETAIEDLFLEWEEQITSEIVGRRMKSDDFLRPPGVSTTNVHGYRDEFEKEPDSDS